MCTLCSMLKIVVRYTLAIIYTFDVSSHIYEVAKLRIDGAK